MLEWIALGIAVVGSGYAAWHDYKTSIIPDELNYFMIAAGAILLFLTQPFEQAIWFYGIAGAVFVLGYIVYSLGQLGGGDVKWFTALALLLPQYPTVLTEWFAPISTPYPFIVSVFFVAAVTSMFVVSIWYGARLWKDRKKIKDFNKKFLKGLTIGAIMLPLFYIWATINVKMLVVALPMLMGGMILAFKDFIMEKYVSMKKDVSKLNDDDVIAIELMTPKMKKALGMGVRRTLDEKSLEKIKANARKHKIKSVIVSEYLPQFGPFILLSLLLNLVFGDVFLWLLFA